MLRSANPLPENLLGDPLVALWARGGLGHRSRRQIRKWRERGRPRRVISLREYGLLVDQWIERLGGIPV